MPLSYEPNRSILFTEPPLLERPEAAKRAGFDAVEFWWPFPVDVPRDEVEEFISAVTDSGVQLVRLNFFAGDMPGGDRGQVSWPARSAEFRGNVDVTVGIGRRLGCRAFNGLYGLRIDGEDPAAQDDLAVSNLAIACRAADDGDGLVLVEPVSRAAGYPLLTAKDAIAVIERVSRRPGSTIFSFSATCTTSLSTAMTSTTSSPRMRSNRARAERGRTGTPRTGHR